MLTKNERYVLEYMNQYIDGNATIAVWWDRSNKFLDRYDFQQTMASLHLKQKVICENGLYRLPSISFSKLISD